MSFWTTKTLPEMTPDEWEALCDGCGKCCLHKLEDEGTGKVFYTSVACRLLDLKTCRCTNYPERTRLVTECLDLTNLDRAEFNKLPSTCAYRLIAEGKGLPNWHPLVSGNVKTVLEAGVSIRSYAVVESQVKDVAEHVIEWLE